MNKKGKEYLLKIMKVYLKKYSHYGDVVIDSIDINDCCYWHYHHISRLGINWDHETLTYGNYTIFVSNGSYDVKKRTINKNGIAEIVDYHLIVLKKGDRLTSRDFPQQYHIVRI